MAIRYKALTELYQETQRSVTAPDQWRAFLASACRNYRLPFDEQLLVYAQRPDATAVLEIERWNRQFGRWVNRGANGIAVFDGEHNGKPRLKYYFDISDTHEARFPRPVPLWTVREEYAPDIIETLENSFGELEHKEDLGEALLSAAKNAVEDNMPDYLSELKTLTEGSFLEELDELNLEVEYRRAVQNSIGYMLLVHCGLDPSDYFEDEDFRDVLNFNTPQTLNALGVAAGDISQMCLSAISRTVLALQRQPQKENRTFEPQQKNQYAVTEQENTQPERSFEYDRDHLHQAGRLQSAEPSAAPGGAGSPWEIRIASEEISQGAPQGDVHEPADQREIEHTSGGDPAERPAPDGGNRGADGESRGRDGGTESQRSDEVGADDEQPAERGGGNGAGGADLQLTTQEPEPGESAGGKQLPALLDEKQIMAIIANKDDDLKYKKNQIELFFSVHSDAQERADYLKSAYHDRYTEIIADGQRLGYKPQENGLLMWEGSYPSRTKESVFSWDIVAQWTAQLIDKKEYFIQTDIPQLPTQESQQMSLFDFAAFQQPAQAEGTAQPSIFPHPALPQQVIDEALCIGANDQNSRLIICAYFKKDKPDNARFLSEHYGENGAGFYLDGRQYAIWYNAEGIRIAQGESAQRSSATLIPWEQAAARIRELLDLGRYMPQSELDRVDEYERQQRAAQLWYLRQDFAEGTADAGYLPTVNAIYGKNHGFPEESAAISDLLGHPEELQNLRDELEQFVQAYRENRELLRFHFHRPQKLLEQLSDLQREPLHFTAAEGYAPQRRFFISGDEIDNLLRGGKRSTDYRLAVYSFYRNHTERKERENFLKHYHGEYSGHSGGNDDVTYQLSKGVSFSHGSITAPYAKVELKWNAVEKRVSAMIVQGRFLTDEDRAAMPQYEKHQLARNIRTFFENVPQEQPHPYPFGFDYWDAVKLIEPQLDDPARVEEIYQMMVPIWEATPQDDRMYTLRRQAFENLAAFRQGTFTLFAEHKEPVAPTTPQAKAYDLGYGHLGNGLTVWNRLEEEHGDYKTVAHIAPDRTVTIYDEEMPQAVREEIQRIADTSEMTISATQDAPVFTVPPRVQEPPQKEELADPYPELAAQVLRFVGEFDGSRMGYGEDDAQAVENIAQQLHDPVQREEIRRLLQSFLDHADPEEEIAVDITLCMEQIAELPPALTPEQAQIEEIAGYLEEAGYAASSELIEEGLMDYRAHGGKGNCQDVADFIEREFLSEEPEPASLEIAKEFINDFCVAEYGSPADFSDLEKVGIAYTTVTDEEIPIQVNADLVHYRMERYLGGQFLERRQYESLDELIQNELAELDFDDLISVSDGELESIGAMPEQGSDGYFLLSRLKADCEYFLGAGGRAEKHLWAGNVREQIAKMRELYAALPEKPEWLTQEDIERYAQRMEPPFEVVVYHHFENGFDERLDYQTLAEAEQAAQKYVAGTMEGEDGFAYDGAGVYDLQENRWLRVYGNFPDERAMEQAKQAPATEEPTASPEQADLQPQKEEALPPPPKRPRRERITFTTLHPEAPRDQRHDFRITDDALGHGTPSEKYAANAAAIRTLKQIEAEERLATPEEQKILSRYVGWGGLADCFEETSPHYEELKSLLDSEEYAAARASTLTAFYTPPVVIRGIYKALAQMGFTQGNILEPSCGTGNFLGLLPADMAGSKAYGVELDSISGRIAGQLYQNASISVNGFETVQMPDSFFDVAVGNVPFGDFKVLDKRYDKHHWLIHDYFFGKTLDKVRPGGIVAFITSKGTLDKENSAVRKYLAQRADLIGAIRLPDNTFKRNAGTEVTSDIIFLQKRDHITDLEQDWVHLDTDENGIRMNRYFVQHPEMILGDMVMESTRFGPDSACKAREGEDLSEQLANAIQFLQAEIKPYELEELDEEEDKSIPADPTVKNFSYTLVDGQVYYRENSLMHPVEVSVTAENRIRGMIELRECVRRLIEYQTEGYPDEDIAAEQQKLNVLYDSFTAKYGLINSRGNKLAFSEDSSYCLLCSLEVLDEQGNLKRKADMFSKRTIRPHVAVTSVDTASEALAVSISEKARVDMDYMAELSGKSPEELEQELAGVIYRDIRCAENPEDILPSLADLSRYPLVTADEYLSGKVRQKLRMAKAFLEVAPDHQKEAARRNVEALEAVQPQDLGAGEIGVRIGANWVPIEVYQQFMVELLTPNYYVRDRIRILRSEATGQWSIREKNADRSNVKANTTYGTKRMSAYHILEQTLNQKDVRVFDYIEDENGKKKPALNKKETAIAQDRQELIKQKFAEWIWKDIDRRELLCRIYNETFNGVRPREYDGRHIRFEGMNPEISLRPHQINAIAHILYGGNTLLAHEVGAGKTYEMVAAAMEMKRLGLCTKSLIVVPNHITEQWAAEWLQLYPSANILVATKKDFETQNRKKFCSRIATGDYDAIIIGHSQFEKIPMSVERQQAILERQIEEILEGIEQAKAQKAERYTVKQMERTRKSLETRLAKLNDQSRKDDVVTFEQLGIDRLFIDESHYFKNLFLATKMRNVGGIAQTEAQKSSDLFMKTQYLDELTGGRGTIFATGTPISNSMVELYTIQRYLQYRLLQEMGLIHFDDWASNFGETVTAIELSPEGTGYRAKTRFAKFYNLPELMAAFKEVADIQTADMLKLPVPKANFHTEVIQPSELQKEMIRGLAERAEKIRAGGVDPHVDNMLRITNDGRKLALDMRLIQPLAPDDPNGKVAVCARNVFRIWEQTKEKRSAQLVFCDLSTPTTDGSFSVYDDLKKKLMDAGIPEEEIAFIHTADSEAKKKELFSKVRAGQVRVLLGSTAKMGAGTNVQDRLIALHDLDCPWRPSDLQQRLGRIVRQGNENEEVEIYRYVTEGTFDAYLYQLVENKQKFIAQIMTSKAPVRVADDVDETALSYSEIKALATGNPLIIEKCNLDMEVARLNMLKASHLNQVYALEELVYRKYPEEITRLTERIAGYEQDLALAAAHPKAQEGFCGMEVDGRHYTEKEDAGKAIIDVCTRMTGSDAVLLGQYRGFSMVLAYDGRSNEYRITLKGTLSHTVTLGADVFGNITRLDNALENLAGSLQAEQNSLEETKAQLENARTELATPFAREEELAEKTDRLKELNILLNMDEKDKTLMDDTPDEGEDVPARRVAELAR
ncbi:LPD11 domain-containing protein [Ruthenibacterium lactatiformans]|uniref:DNA methylase n=5 Tax=Eubacteriales TaxID=186802 RepID=A0A6I3Q7X6_9FIRM|nr:DNA methylase [Lactonifactor sp. BIOML-A5]MSA09607.1 DNA methylase [Lactonifactor sp. BIOML-A4]MSA17700.1 DNA methylase [Lactonifactor sp. BIOML-A2]MSA38175.1 DNA methylase [Lactonifactor sp. BIOML-A1]MSB14099.1 DNA methylase [Lactonifactor sp. BIOML-A6]MSB69324.1 DNA methylase [Lactonifactor sp. BIOML-A7]MTQ80645.1 DNA methylase [Ruthenibacterium lactatiformans]MZL69918.1 DEAD/DEAH box helicase family protein [Bittarella massiliensis (ex Durand et al. 2017)]